MSTANITWTNQSPSNTQELYYGRDLLVTGFPGSGTGWIASDQNPLPGTQGSISIAPLDDNVKYKFLVRSDCANSQNIFSQSTAIKWVCGGIQTSGPSSGILAYTLQVDPSASNAGSAVTKLVVTLTGTDRLNQGFLYQTRSYSAPFSSSYTDQFNNVNGDIDWTLRVTYEQGTFPQVIVHECSSQTYQTVAAPLTSYLHIRNALTQGVVSQVSLGTNPQLPSILNSGYASKSDITSLIANPQQITCTLSDVPLGTSLQAKQIRGGTTITGGSFTYGGSNSNISATPWTLQNGDVVEITDASKTGYIYRQHLVSKGSSGYDITVKIDTPQGASTSYTVKFTAYDYSSSATENLTATITLASGQTVSPTIHIPTTLLPDQFFQATITAICVIPPSGISAPYYYICP